MKVFSKASIHLVMVICCLACKKEIKHLKVENIVDEGLALSPTSAAVASSLPYCWEDSEDGLAYDSVLKPTILGAKLIGEPYSVAKMQQASLNLTGSSTGITENKWYVRFKPTIDQIAILEDLDIDLFDYPLDYELSQDGDYYNDGVTPPENIPWLYAVVDKNFVPPTGVTYELLKRLHVPSDYRLENEAFRITGNSVDTAACGGSLSLGDASTMGGPPCDCDSGPVGCPCLQSCGFGMCSTPLPPVPVVRIPVAHITVTDTRRNLQVPIRNARMVARRFLKIERVFTDNNGNCQFTKSFRNKFTLLIKFKNNNAIIKGLRGIRLWQMLNPVKINLGRFRGNVNNVFVNINPNTNADSRGARHWAAATTHNAIQEYINDRAPIEVVGVPPNKLRVLLVKNNDAGSAPMFSKRFISTLPDYYIRHFMLSASGLYLLTYINSLATVLASRVDLTIGYNEGNDVTSLSDQLTEVCYHELTHAAHYNKIGNNAYGNLVQAELNELLNNFSTDFSPYGDGNTSNSPIIALGESWAYHMGHFLTNRKYGFSGGAFREQQINYFDNFPVAGINSNLNLLEDFNPARIDDPFFWIPQGLYYDLFDNRNDNATLPPRVLLPDVVSSYTNQQFFNALDADISTLPAFRNRLLSENANRDAPGVTSIFNFYGY
ncbi:MAG: hypothetical protein EOO88_24825 [Pedobacter sp.]|nr:MAG: hypothetical protein EOO88_24825 [Pedobacter sp.]